MNPLHVIEIIRRSDQGVTLPFLCRASDDRFYWVKGRNTGMAGLCHEWIAGQIARDFQLPIPEFSLIEVSQQIVSNCANEEAASLGAGIAFASLHVENAGDLPFYAKNRVDPELRRRLLAFDCWVQNEDRTLGAQGGNVNLLWDQWKRKPWVIDHNNAFDTSFSRQKILRNHVFSEEMHRKSESFALAIQDEMRDIHARFASYLSDLPDEWIGIAQTHPDFSLERIEDVVSGYEKVADLFRTEP